MQNNINERGFFFCFFVFVLDRSGWRRWWNECTVLYTVPRQQPTHPVQTLMTIFKTTTTIKRFYEKESLMSISDDERERERWKETMKKEEEERKNCYLKMRQGFLFLLFGFFFEINR